MFRCVFVFRCTIMGIEVWRRCTYASMCEADVYGYMNVCLRLHNLHECRHGG